MMALIDQYNDHFELKTGEELVAVAQQVVADLGLSQKLGDITERLLRHYVTEGVVSRPVREGREVRYGFRHLLELLAVRMWVLQGFPLSSAHRYSVHQPNDKIIEALKTFRLDDKAASADMLVKLFRASSAPEPGTLRESGRMYDAASPALSRKPVSSNIARFGLADVLQEMRITEARLQQQLQELNRRFHDVLRTNAQTRELLGRVEDQQRLLITTADQQKDFVRDMFRDLHDTQQAQMQQMLTRLFDEHTAKILAAVRTTRLNDTNDKPDINPAP